MINADYAGSLCEVGMLTADVLWHPSQNSVQLPDFRYSPLGPSCASCLRTPVYDRLFSQAVLMCSVPQNR